MRVCGGGGEGYLKDHLFVCVWGGGGGGGGGLEGPSVPYLCIYIYIVRLSRCSSLLAISIYPD